MNDQYPDEEYNLEFCCNSFSTLITEMQRLTMTAHASLIEKLREKGVDDEIICEALMTVCGMAGMPVTSHTEFLNNLYGLKSEFLN